MAFADVTAKLRLDISDFASGMSSAAKQMGSFAKSVNKQYGAAAKTLSKHNFGLKDTARIVQGILVAQTFYTGARAIREATIAVWDFNKALDYAHVTYSALFGDATLASNFMSALQEHSIETIFDYQDLADASKKLLAYGIEYKNLMFIMEGLTNLGAMSGDTAALDRISLALGQIYTRGKLTAEEIRQLANAYIPISDIIQDKFNLSSDDMGRVGDLNLQAGEVINAIVDYANERFASVGDAAMYTIVGLQNKIVDTLKVMGVEMLKPVSTAYKSFLAYIANGLEVIRAKFASGGIGGVFEYLVPDPNTQQMIRQFIANVRNLFVSLVSVGVVAGQIFGNFAHVFITAFNIISPIIVSFTNYIAAALNGMLSTSKGAAVLRVALLGAAAAFIILRVHAVASLVITAVAKAVYGLSKALLVLATIIVRHPIIALLVGLAVALVGVSTASGNATSGLNKFFDTISGAAGGLSSGDIFGDVEQEIADSTGAVDEFNNRFEEGASAAEDMAENIDKVGSAADKAKKRAGLLSFDEVFKLNESSDASGSGGTGGGIGDDIAGIIDGLGGLGDALIPEVPDFSNYIRDFVDGLFGGIDKGIRDRLKDAGIGALIGTYVGAVIGGLLGNPILGAKIGAVAGGLVGWFWNDIQAKIGLSDTQGVAAGFATAIGAAIGSVLGGPAGTLIGAAIGTLASGLTSLLWNKLADAFGKSASDADAAAVGATIGLAVCSVIGGIIGGPVGVLIGAAIGTFAGGIVGLFWDSIKEAFKKSETRVGYIIGNTLGTTLTGGSLVGSLIGSITGAIVGDHWDKIKPVLERKIGELGYVYRSTLNRVFSKPDAGLGASLGASLTAIFGPVAQGIGALVGGALGAFWDEISEGFKLWWEDISKGFSDWWDNLEKGWNDWLDAISLALTNWWDSLKRNWPVFCAAISAVLSAWWDNTKTKWLNKYNELKTELNAWWNNVKSTFTNVTGVILNVLETWWSNTKTKWLSRYDELKTALSTWWDKVKLLFTNMPAIIMSALETWWSDTKTKWLTRYNEIKTNLSTWWNGVQSLFSLNFSELINTTVNKLLTVKDEWSKKWDAIKTNLSTWWRSLKRDMSNWLEEYIWKPIADFFNLNNFWNRIKNLLNAIKNKMTTWWDGITDVFSSGGSGGAPTKSANVSLGGHAAGGIFNREHIARFAEGNKAEAVIPLENASAMQPFVTAISDGILQGLLPVMVSNSGQSNLPPMYVGTLIADDRGLRQLYQKFEIIEAQEAARKGFA